MSVDTLDIRGFWFKNNASIPAQWAEDTDGAGRFFQGEDASWDPATDPLTGGGVHVHTVDPAPHTHLGIQHDHGFYTTSMVTLPTVVHVRADAPPYGSTTACLADHDHGSEESPGTTAGATTTYTSQSVSCGSVTALPEYLTVLLIKPASVGADLPPDVLVFGDSATPPDGYANIMGHGDYESSWNGRLLRGAANGGDGGSVGGDTDDKHLHGMDHAANHGINTHDHPEVDAPPGQEADTEPAARVKTIRVLVHHRISTGDDIGSGNLVGTEFDSDEEAFAPAWVKLLGIYNSGGQAATPSGVIVAFVGDPADIPTNWQLCDGTGDTAEDCTGRHVKLTTVTTEIGDTGGDNNHTHSSTHGHVERCSHYHVAVVTWINDTTDQGGGTVHDVMQMDPIPGDNHGHAWTIVSATGTVQDTALTLESADGRGPFLNVLWIRKIHDPMPVVPAGQVLFVGAVPSLDAAADITAPSGNVKFVGHLPTLSATATLAAPAGTVTFASPVPRIHGEGTLKAPAGTVHIVGGVANLTADAVLYPPAGGVTFTGLLPTLDEAAIQTPPVGVMEIVGPVPAVDGAASVSAPSGTFAFVGLPGAAGNLIVAPVGAAVFIGSTPLVIAPVPSGLERLTANLFGRDVTGTGDAEAVVADVFRRSLADAVDLEARVAELFGRHVESGIDLEAIVAELFERGLADTADLEARMAQLFGRDITDGGDAEATVADLFELNGLDGDMLGETVVYHPDGGDPKEIQAVVQLDTPQEQSEDRRGISRNRAGTVYVAYDDTNGVASPTRKDQITIRGETFDVVDFGEHQGGNWAMQVTRAKVVSGAPAPFRMDRV